MTETEAHSELYICAKCGRTILTPCGSGDPRSRTDWNQCPEGGQHHA